MSMSQALILELDQEMANTRQALERVPQDRLGWKPHEKSFTLGDLSNHLARLPSWGTETLKTEVLDLNPEAGGFNPPPPAETVEGILDLFDGHVRELRGALEGVGDAFLTEPWTLLNGGQKLFTLPRVQVLRGMIFNHIIHHRGQLTVYLRLNEIPVPALYGPSADEGM